jgi:hypothetical protein
MPLYAKLELFPLNYSTATPLHYIYNSIKCWVQACTRLINDWGKSARFIQQIVGRFIKTEYRAGHSHTGTSKFVFIYFIRTMKTSENFSHLHMIAAKLPLHFASHKNNKNVHTFDP